MYFLKMHFVVLFIFVFGSDSAMYFVKVPFVVALGTSGILVYESLRFLDAMCGILHQRDPPWVLVHSLPLGTSSPRATGAPRHDVQGHPVDGDGRFFGPPSPFGPSVSVSIHQQRSTHQGSLPVLAIQRARGSVRAAACSQQRARTVCSVRQRIVSTASVRVLERQPTHTRPPSGVGTYWRCRDPWWAVS